MPSLTLPLGPGTNRIYRKFNGRMVLSPEAKAFKDATRIQAYLSGHHEPADGPISVSIAYHPRANKNKPGEAVKRRLDVDAPCKIVLDALIGIAYHDDHQVEAITCRLAPPVTGGALVVSWQPCNPETP